MNFFLNTSREEDKKQKWNKLLHVYPNMSLIPFKNEIPVTLMLIPAADELQKILVLVILYDLNN